MDQVEFHNEDDEDYQFTEILEDWNRLREVAIGIITFAAFMIRLMLYKSSNKDALEPETPEQREQERKNFLRGLEYESYCRSVIRMTPVAFHKLCAKLIGTGVFKQSSKASTEEQVAKFLLILSHQERNRCVCFFFRRSSETTSRHFHNVLGATLHLQDEFLIQPNGAVVPPKILDEPKFYPYFEDCVGAIDGTHIRAFVPKSIEQRFRGRKDVLTQNVLAACSFDLKFTYVLAGFEGSAADSKIIKNALTREDNLIIPQGKYYLVDAGFMLKPGLLAPYRGERYHLKEYSTRAPTKPQEIFNLRHASLRNAIERSFGILKKRFPIIGSYNDKTYPYETQCDMVLACCILHNFFMAFDPDEELISEADRELERQQNLIRIQRSSSNTSANVIEDEYALGAQLRDNIAARMWNDYIRNR